MISLSALFAFLFGMLFASSLMMAAFSVGHWKRRGEGRVVLSWRDRRRVVYPSSWWQWAALVAWCTLVLPIGMIHDAIAPGQPWIEWAEADE